MPIVSCVFDGTVLSAVGGDVWKDRTVINTVMCYCLYFISSITTPTLLTDYVWYHRCDAIVRTNRSRFVQ